MTAETMTAGKLAPWYIVPANHKWAARRALEQEN